MFHRRASNASSSGRYIHASHVKIREHSISRTARFASVARPLTVIRRLHAHCGPPVTQPGSRSDSLDLHFWIGIDAKRIAASCQTGQASFITPYRSHHGHSRIA